MDPLYIFIGLIILVAVVSLVSKRLKGTDDDKTAPLSNPEIKEAISSGNPVLLYFSTTTCPNCRLMIPIISRLNRKKGISVVKINAKKDMKAAMDYKVRGVPAIFIIRDGEIIKKFTNFVSESELLVYLL